MKKIIFLLFSVVVLFAAISLTTSYATEIQTCFTCDSSTIGKLPYNIDSEDDVIFNYQTNLGYVTDGVNPNGVVMKLDDCDAVGDLLSTTNYDLNIKILTDGVYFLPPAESATNVSVAISNYTVSETACELNDDIYKVVQCTISENKKNCYSIEDKAFLEAGKVFFKITLPTMYYVPAEIDPLQSIEVRIAINNVDKICVSCDDSICDCVKTIAIFKTDTYDSTLQYVIVDISEWWTGIALTNFDDVNAYTKITLKSDDIVQEQIMNIPANQVKTFLVSDLFNGCEIGYLIIQSSNDIDALCIIGSDSGIYGYQSRK